MPSESHFYNEAGILYCKVAAGICGIKSALFQSGFTSDLKKLLAVVSESIKKKYLINEIFKRYQDKHLRDKRKVKKVNGLRECTDGSGCSDCAAKVQIYDMMFGQANTNTCGCPLIGKMKLFRSILDEIMKEKNVTTQEEILNIYAPESKNITLPIYVRINFCLTTRDEVLSHFSDSGYNYLDYEDRSVKYNQFLEWVQGLDNQDFMPDFHLHNDVLVFHPSAVLYKDKFVEDRKVLIQDKASCIPALVLDPDLDMDIIDACAAPGNKTSHLLSILSQKTIIDHPKKLFAFDRDQKRCSELRATLTRYIDCPVAQKVSFKANCFDFSKVDPFDPKYENVGYILLDPSCSGSGMIRSLDRQIERNNQVRIDATRLTALKNFQCILLGHALKFPKVKRVVYSTCSLTVNENEEVVEEALEKFGDNFALKGIWIDRWMTRAKKNLKECIRTNPNYDLCNGFFVACFERKANVTETRKDVNFKKFKDNHNNVDISGKKKKRRKKKNKIDKRIRIRPNTKLCESAETVCQIENKVCTENDASFMDTTQNCSEGQINSPIKKDRKKKKKQTSCSTSENLEHNVLLHGGCNTDHVETENNSTKLESERKTLKSTLESSNNINSVTVDVKDHEVITGTKDDLSLSELKSKRKRRHDALTESSGCILIQDYKAADESCNINEVDSCRQSRKKKKKKISKNDSINDDFDCSKSAKVET